MNNFKKIFYIVYTPMVYIGMTILPILGLVGVPGCLVASAIVELILIASVIYMFYVRKCRASIYDPKTDTKLPEDE